MKIKQSEKINNHIIKLISLIILITNISQLPYLHGNLLIKLITLSSWIILLYYLLYNFNQFLSFKIFALPACLGIFDIFILSGSLFTEKRYISSNFIYPLHLCIFIFIVSYFSGQLINKNSIIRIIDFFCYSSSLVAIVIYLEYFKDIDWQNASGYIYTAKNSIGQIILISIVLLLLFERSTFNRIFRIILIYFSIFFLLIIKSRATLLGFILGIIYIVLFYLKDRKKKLAFVILILLIFILTFNNEYFYNFFINNIFLNNRQGTNLDVLSSGRVSHLQYFYDNFYNYSLSGTGGTYLESFPLAALMSYGIFGATILFIISVLPIYYSLKKYSTEDFRELRFTIIVLTLILLINSLFEELPPFGPGVKCYALWMFTGLYVGIRQRKNKKCKK